VARYRLTGGFERNELLRARGRVAPSIGTGKVASSTIGVMPIAKRCSERLDGELARHLPANA